MRLTLRTLLAYMDDILDPADHEELAKKIEASDFAAELIHRSRDTVRRPPAGRLRCLPARTMTFSIRILPPTPIRSLNT